MRYLIILIAILFLIPVAHAQEKEKLTKEDLTPEDLALLEKDFTGALRGFVWGLSPTVILENERGTFMGEENGSLLYLDYIRGLKSTIGYEFLDNKLWKARIFIEKEYVDQQNQLRDLMVIAEDLTKRLGEPVKEEFRWVKDREKNFPDKWGWAIYRSELFVTLAWEDEETIAIATLGAEKLYDPQLVVTYIDRRANATLQREKAKNPLNLP